MRWVSECTLFRGQTAEHPTTLFQRRHLRHFGPWPNILRVWFGRASNFCFRLDLRRIPLPFSCWRHLTTRKHSIWKGRRRREAGTGRQQCYVAFRDLPASFASVHIPSHSIPPPRWSSKIEKKRISSMWQNISAMCEQSHQTKVVFLSWHPFSYETTSWKYSKSSINQNTRMSLAKNTYSFWMCCYNECRESFVFVRRIIYLYASSFTMISRLALYSFLD